MHWGAEQARVLDELVGFRSGSNSDREGTGNPYKYL